MKEIYDALVLDSGKPCKLWQRHYDHLEYGAFQHLKNMVRGFPNFKVAQI
jgi:hypothetical protein